MSAKVRYILGAGASYGSIPIVREMPNRVKEYYLTFRYLGEFLKAHSTPGTQLMERAHEMQLWAGRLAGLHSRLVNAFSFDTLAKFYWAQGVAGEKKYNELKEAIALIICTEHLVKSHNSRYDAFVAALAIKEKALSRLENVQILNWNYDFQFLLSLRSIDRSIDLPEFVLKLNHVYLNGFTSWEHFNLNPSNGAVLSRFPEFLNTQKLSREEKESILPLSKDLGVFWSNDLFGQIKKHATRTLKFSWELEEINLRNRVSNFDPTVAVIIGYSLPTFNRTIDKLTLAPFIGVSTGKRIYVQCTPEKNKEVKSKLEGLGVKSDIIKLVDQIDEFHIPFEYDF